MVHETPCFLEENPFLLTGFIWMSLPYPQWPCMSLIPDLKVTFFMHNSRANILQQAQLPVVSYDACVKGNSHLQAIDDRSMLCAGYDGANASPVSGCNGDSGGPFVCQDSSRNWVLHGAVSWGDYKCRGSPTYSVFTRISSFVDWIQDHVTKQQGEANHVT